jgi:hypothetical protein
MLHESYHLEGPIHRMNFQEYLLHHFPKLSIEPPLYYNAPFGIRFELGVPYRDIDDPSYFKTVLLRSTMLFNEIFSDYEEFFVLVKTYKCVEPFEDHNQGIDVFPIFLIDKKLMCEIECFKTDKHSEEDGQLSGISQHFSLKVLKRDLNYQAILKAIGNQDFGISPFITDEVYFIEPRKSIIYHMYDDCGLDVVSNNRETLQSLYTKFNSWILDYDRDAIDRTFKK